MKLSATQRNNPNLSIFFQNWLGMAEIGDMRTVIEFCQMQIFQSQQEVEKLTNLDNLIKALLNTSANCISAAATSYSESAVLMDCLPLRSKRRKNVPRAPSPLTLVFENRYKNSEEFSKTYHLDARSVDWILEQVQKWNQGHNKVKPKYVQRAILSLILYLTTNTGEFLVGKLFGGAQPTTHKDLMLGVELLLQTFYYDENNRQIEIPGSEEGRREICRGFENLCSIENIIGAIDTTFIAVDAPQDSECDFFDGRKLRHGVKLQGLVDSNSRFIDILVNPARPNDPGLYAMCDLKDRLLEMHKKSGYLVLADGVYALREEMLIPYNRQDTYTLREINYNIWHTKGRVRVEHAFAFLKNKWARLTGTFKCSPANAINFVKCACVLHNIAISMSSSTPFGIGVARDSTCCRIFRETDELLMKAYAESVSDLDAFLPVTNLSNKKNGVKRVNQELVAGRVKRKAIADKLIQLGYVTTPTNSKMVFNGEAR